MNKKIYAREVKIIFKITGISILISSLLFPLFFQTRNGFCNFIMSKKYVHTNNNMSFDEYDDKIDQLLSESDDCENLIVCEKCGNGDIITYEKNTRFSDGSIKKYYLRHSSSVLVEKALNVHKDNYQDAIYLSAYDILVSTPWVLALLLIIRYTHITYLWIYKYTN